MAFDEQAVRRIAERVAGSSGLEIADIEFHGAGKHRMLRVFIDRPGAIPSHHHPDGVTHEHCANFSREVGTILDVEDVVPWISSLFAVFSRPLSRIYTSSRYFAPLRQHHSPALAPHCS